MISINLGSFLVLVIFSASGYRAGDANKADNNHKRQLLSFISTTITSNRTSEVYILQDDAADSDILLVADNQPQFGLRIYNYHNNLVADYGEISGSLNPQDAVVLGENSRFEIRKLSDNLLVFVTDQGELMVSTEYLKERGTE